MDERERHEAFLSEHGPAAFDRLMFVWNSSYTTGTAWDRLWGRGRTKESVFKSRAKLEGFSKKCVKDFMELA